jgi:hypothetical protein
VQASGPSPLDRAGRPADTFSILLQGIYQPVRHGPNLGLFDVDLSDGSFSTTKIFPVSVLPDFDRGHDKRGQGLGNRDGDTEAAIGNFYVQFSRRCRDLVNGPVRFCSIEPHPSEARYHSPANSTR